MSALKDLGGCLWKLFQLGIVVAILVLGFMFIAKPQKEKEELAVEEKVGERKVEKAGDTGLIAKLQKMFGGEEKKEVKLAQGGMKSGDRGKNELEVAQAEAGEEHVDLKKLLELSEDVRREVDFLAEGTTQVQQQLFWQIVGDNIHYRIILTPYDRRAHELMMRPGEALFMSFLSTDEERLVPRSADFRIDMKKLRVATTDGYAVGWFYDGRLPLGGVNPAAVDHGSVGWIFSNRLHARLRTIQGPKAPAKETVDEPFSIDIPVDKQGKPIKK